METENLTAILGQLLVKGATEHNAPNAVAEEAERLLIDAGIDPAEAEYYAYECIEPLCDWITID